MERVKRMDDLIRKRATGTPEEFANKLNISRSQLLQDLKEFKQLGAPVEYCTIRGTYQYAKDCPSLFDFRTEKIYGGLHANIVESPYYWNERTPMQRQNSWVQFSRFYFFALLFVFSCAVLHAQTITGKVLDSNTGKPLTGVEVFINQTTVGTQSNETGEFVLERVQTGFQEIVLYKNGYTLYRSSMKIQTDRSYKLNLSLVAFRKKKTTKLTQQERTKLSEKLISTDEKNSLITPVHDEIVGINKIEGKQLLLSKTPLTLKNEATGYQLKYYFMEVPLQDVSQAPVWYEPLLAASIEQTILWEKERKKIFEGSERHWLMALAAGKLDEEGYTLQDERGVTIEPQSLLSPSSLPDYVKLTIPQTLVLHYKRAEGAIETSHVSTQGSVDVHTSGLLLNAKALTITGDMVKEVLANQLPIDYQPIAGEVEDSYAKTLEKFYEKIYVHTDKPYYYPGEALWFKGYIHYKEPAWRDSLSRVVYVELINPKKEIIQSKTLKIDSGFFHNDFILPDTLTAGTYYLRAYTNLNRNFGDSNLYVKPIPILHLKTKVDPALGKLEEVTSPYLTISTDKKVYKPREKITLTIQTRDREGKPTAAHLSVSVTDATQVVPIKETETIVTAFQEDEHPKVTDLKHPVEYGVVFRGKFVNDNNKPEQTTLTILQMNPRNMLLAATDEQGIFSLAGLDFYDSTVFSVKSDKAKDLPYGRVTILPRESVPMIFEENPITLSVQQTEFQQRIVSEYEVPSDVRMLKEIEIRGSRVEKEPVDRVQRPYGEADYTIKLQDSKIKYNSLLSYLIGRVPGLVIRSGLNGTVVYIARAGTSSITNSGEVMVMYNNVPLGGSPAAILESINPETVESIEVTNRINVLYGSQGVNGVISIYTKQNVSEDLLTSVPNFQTIKSPGYSSSRLFISPDYNNPNGDNAPPDYRSSIYWNPGALTDVMVGTIESSFFTTDMTVKYRIIVEGVNQDGEAMRSEHFVEVEDY